MGPRPSHPAFQGHWNCATDQLAAYDFLLVIHCNHAAIKCCFQDKRQFRLEITHFHHPCTFSTP